MAEGDLGKPAVDLREDEGVWWITFNRPEASNAFTLI
jgi:enoyl-CoA hydratase/carnithine racemase